MNRRNLLLAAYGAVAVVTFGHCAGHLYREDQREYAACQARGGTCFHTPELAPTAGILAGVFWPLYWSWEAFS